MAIVFQEKDVKRVQEVIAKLQESVEKYKDHPGSFGYVCAVLGALVELDHMKSIVFSSKSYSDYTPQAVGVAWGELFNEKGIDEILAPLRGGLVNNLQGQYVEHKIYDRPCCCRWFWGDDKPELKEIRIIHRCVITFKDAIYINFNARDKQDLTEAERKFEEKLRMFEADELKAPSPT